MLGGGPRDEEQPPDDVDPNLFDFFGYGQPSNAGQANEGYNNNNQDANPGIAPQWGIWPDGPEGQDDAPFIGPPMNAKGPAAPNNENPQPAPNPVIPMANDFLELNDMVPNGNVLDFDLNMAVEEDLGGNRELGS